MRLDLGCGPVPEPGYTGVDIEPPADFVVDLQAFPWPFPTNSVQAARSSHLVEHLPDLVGFMRELWRVCEDGAEVWISHPYQFNVRAWQDPTHCRAINEVSWFYFDAKWRDSTVNTWGGYGPTDFEVVDITAIPTPEWMERAKEDPAEFERAAHNLINVIADLHVTLRARK